MATNLLGLVLNRQIMYERHPGDHKRGMTLGAFRRGKDVTWVPGATIDVWTKCARMETVTGVPWPHAHFRQTIGGEDGGSIFCPTCRAEVAANRAAKEAGRPRPAPPRGQLSLF